MPIVEMEIQRQGDFDALRSRLGNSGHIRHAMDELLNEAARIGEHSATLYAPEQSRRLKRAITSTRARETATGASEARVGVSEIRAGAGGRLGPMREGENNYPLFVEQGTGLFGPLHRRITAKRRGAMVFMGRTGLVVTRSTRGQRPQRYMRHAFDDVAAYIPQRIGTMVDRILRSDV